MLAYWDEIGETWEWQTFEPEQLIEADGVVVALWQETVRIRDSQSDIRSSTASLIKVRDGKVIEMRGYMDPDEALRAGRAAAQDLIRGLRSGKMVGTGFDGGDGGSQQLSPRLSRGSCSGAKDQPLRR